MANVIELSQANFQAEVLESAQPVLVDFWGTGCPPCVAMAPVIEQLADENAGSAKVGKVNVRESQELAIQYRIEAIPTLILFKNGEIADRFLGMQPKQRLQDAIDQAL